MNYYARDQCMVCREKPPELEALWEYGKAHAWLCPGCFPEWKEKHGESLLATKAAAHGVARRRFDDEESPQAACEGLYLAAPHGELIYGGIKTSIVKHRPFPELTNGTFILVSDGKAYGLVTLGEAAEIPSDEFDTHFDAHRVTVKERTKWWPDNDTFWSYGVEAFHALERPCAVEVPSGVQTFLDEVKFLEEDVKIWSVNNPPPCASDWSVAKTRRCVKAANVEYCKSKDDEKAVSACVAAAAESAEKQAPVPEEENMANKELRLDERVSVVYSAWNTENEPPLWNYILEVDDSHIIIEEGSTFYQVSFTWEDDVPVFAARDTWIEVERPWRAVKSFVGPDGADWLMVWTMNAFEDLEDETFTTQSIDEYVERHANDDTKGRFMFWHLPGTDFGDIKAQAVSGRFLVELGTFDQNERGKAFKRFFRENPYGHSEYAPTGWGASHGYQYYDKERKDGVYKWFEKQETSVLPAYAAANPHNPGMEVLRMNDKQREVLTAIGGEGLVAHIEETGIKLTEDLESAGVTFKQLDPKPEATEVKEGEAPEASSESPDSGDEGSMEQLLPEIVKALQLEGLSGVLTAQTDALKALGEQLTGIDGRLAEVEKEDHERLAAKELALPHLSWFQASKAAETVLSADEKKTLAVPGSPPRAVAAIAEVLGLA